MSLTDDLVRLKHQEETLQFSRFDEATAWQLGAYLHRHACERSLPLIVEALCALLGHDPAPLLLGEACPFSE